jgi:acyl-homoserine lactone acylase PvdQ
VPRAFALLALTALPTGCAALFPEPRSLKERLAAFPTADLLLDAPVEVHWNDHPVPFIHARTDRDPAFTLGLVHTHLRAGQMALMKRVAQGRLAEMAGPLDRALRTLDLGYAMDGMIAGLSPETRAWLEAYGAGLNHYQDRMSAPPPELALLGVEPAPWSLPDILTLGRLAGIDVNRLIYFALLPERLGPEWERVWAQVLETGAADTTTASADPVLRALALTQARYPLASLPLIGRRFIYGDYPADGSRETGQETDHALSKEPAPSPYGSESRHLSLLDDLDANWFVLCGGQDGWLGSASFADQVPLWRAGEYTQLPLRPETVARIFPRRLVLNPVKR